MKIIIDNREHDLYDYIQDMALGSSSPLLSDITKECLDVGDIIFRNDGDDTMCIIERKTLNDLMSSIKDGRYTEQSFRLSNSNDIPNHNIFYLIEGNINSIVNPIERKAILSALISINLFKGFSVIRTQSLKETAHYLLAMGEKIDKEFVKKKIFFYNKDGVNTNALEYANVVKTAKKQNITKENIGILMLSQIPGVSTTVAKKILEDYHSIHNFVDALQKQTNILDGLRLEGSTGKMRKIGTNVINSIKTYLL